MQLLIFAGTTEGRELIETLLARGGCTVFVCVATDYGADLLPRHPALHIQTGRLDQSAMETFIRAHSFSVIIDATHPYAKEATENIYGASLRTKTPYLRLLRESQGVMDSILVPSTEAAAAFLNTVTGNALLTTGSKELAAFTAVTDYQERLFARVLPTASVLEQCQKLGFSGKHLIGMQGPFSEALNLALLQQIQAKWLVTKDSGAPGGLEEKCRAAQKAGAQVIVIGRPKEPQETGYSMEEILRKLFPQGPSAALPASEKYFPLFVSLQKKRVVVVGGGRIAKRRVQALLDFGCWITVIAPESEIPSHPHIQWKKRPYQPEDLAEADLVLAATNCRTVNHAVFLECAQQNLPVNVADCKEECSFFFPALIHQGSAVIGVTASGLDHTLAKSIAENIRNHQATIFRTTKESSHETYHPHWQPGKQTGRSPDEIGHGANSSSSSRA